MFCEVVKGSGHGKYLILHVKIKFGAPEKGL
jgi:hypothetical protein